jgi:hypothetical protein
MRIVSGLVAPWVRGAYTLYNLLLPLEAALRGIPSATHLPKMRS